MVVQTGDQLDRGDDERAILDLLDRLEAEAAKAGGAVHVLNGNHETLNVAGDFRYVTPGGFDAFAEVTATGTTAQLASRVPPRARGRALAFLPGGPWARRLARRNTIVIVGRTAFAHGGILPPHADYGLGRINDEIRQWMRGETLTIPNIVSDENSPVWTRRYSDGNLPPDVCGELEGVLSRLDVDRLVVGHTVQKNGITSACNGQVWRIDVGLAAFYGGQTAVLEIAGRRVGVLMKP